MGRGGARTLESHTQDLNPDSAVGRQSFPSLGTLLASFCLRAFVCEMGHRQRGVVLRIPRDKRGVLRTTPGLTQSLCRPSVVLL